MDLPNPGIEPGSPALQMASLSTELSRKPMLKEESPFSIALSSPHLVSNLSKSLFEYQQLNVNLKKFVSLL